MNAEQLDLPTTESESATGGVLGCLGLVLCVVFFVVAIVEHSAGAGFVSIVSLIAVAVWATASNRADKEQRSDAFLSLCKEHDMDYRAESSSSGNELHIATSRNSEAVMVHCRSGTLKINVRQILSIDLVVDDRAVYQSGSALPGAAVGGLAFGGAGAIVGALATSRGKTKEEIRRISLRLRMDSLEEPLVVVDLLSSPTPWSEAQSQVEVAEQWTALIEVMRHRMATSGQEEPR